MPPLKCSVNGCTVNSREVDLYNFPKRLNILQTWIEFCDRGKYWKPRKNSQICSSHFNRADVLTYPSALGRARQLKPNACPTIKVAPKQKSITCAVANCKNNANNSKKDIAYYEFPTDDKMRTKWIRFCGKDACWQPKKIYRVCSEHFKSEDMETVFMRNKALRKLKSGACPSLKGPEIKSVNTNNLNEPAPKKIHLETNANSKLINASIVPSVHSKEKNLQIQNESKSNANLLTKRPFSPRKVKIRDQINPLEIQSRKKKAENISICAVSQCNNISGTKDSALFYTFPKEKLILSKWVEFCGKDITWKPDTNTKICSKHFDLQDFDIDSATKKLILKENAIPSISPNKNSSKITKPESELLTKNIQILGTNRTTTVDNQKMHVPSNPENALSDNNRKDSPIKKLSPTDCKNQQKSVINIKLPKVSKNSKRKKSIDPISQKQDEKDEDVVNLKRKVPTNNQKPIQDNENQVLKLNTEHHTVTRSSSEKNIQWPSNVSPSLTVKELSKSEKHENTIKDNELSKNSPHTSLKTKEPHKITTENSNPVSVNEQLAEHTLSKGSLETQKTKQSITPSITSGIKVKISKSESNETKMLSARNKREPKTIQLQDGIEKTSSRKSISNLGSQNVEDAMQSRKPRSKSLDNAKIRRHPSPKMMTIEENQLQSEHLNKSVTSGDPIKRSSSMEELFNDLSTTPSKDESLQEEKSRERLQISKQGFEISGQTNVENRNSGLYINRALENRTNRGVKQAVETSDIREGTPPKKSLMKRKDEPLSDAKLKEDRLNNESVGSLNLSAFVQDELKPLMERGNVEDSLKTQRDRSNVPFATDGNEVEEISSTTENTQKVSKVIEVSLHNKKIKKKIKVTLNNNKSESSAGENSQNHNMHSRNSSNSKDSEQKIDTKRSSLCEAIRSADSDYNTSGSPQNNTELHEISMEKSNIDQTHDDSESLKSDNDSYDKLHEHYYDNQNFSHNSSRYNKRNSARDHDQLRDKSVESNSSFEMEVLDLPEIYVDPTGKRKIQSKQESNQVRAHSTEKSPTMKDPKALQAFDQSKSERKPSSNINQKRLTGIKSKFLSKKKKGPKRFRRLESGEDEENMKQQSKDVSKVVPNRPCLDERSTINATGKSSSHSEPSSKEKPLHDKVIEVRFPYGSKPGRKIRVTLSSKHELSNVISEKSAKRIEPEKTTETQKSEEEHCSNETKLKCNTLEIENPTKHLNMPLGNNTQNPSEVIVLSPEIKKEAPAEADESSITNLNLASEESRFDIHIAYANSIDQSTPTIKTSPFKNDEDYFNSSVRLLDKQNTLIFHESPATDSSIHSKSPITLSSSGQELQICEVAGCRNNSSKSLNGITFHPFPLNLKKRNKWVEFCKDGGDWKPQEFSRICSKHFQSEDYVYVHLHNKMKKVLKLDAIPSVHASSSDPSSSRSPEIENLMVGDTSSKESTGNNKSALPKQMERNSVVLLESCPVEILKSNINEKGSASRSEERDLSPIKQGRYSPIAKKTFNSFEDQRQISTQENVKKEPNEEDNEYSAESIASNDSNNEGEDNDRGVPSPQSSEKSDDSSDEKYRLRKKVAQQKKLISTLYKSNNELKKKSRKQVESFRTMQKRNLQMEQTKKELQRKILNMERTLKRKSLEDSTMSKQTLRNKIMLSPIGKSLTENQIDLLLQIKKKVKWTTTELATAFSLRYLSKDSYIYDYLKEIYPLPNIEIVQKYAQRISLYGGILKDILEIMNTVGKTMTDKERATILIYDSIPVQSTIQYDLDGDEVVGPYNRMHIIMARGLYSEWKQPVYVDFDRNLTADELKNVVSELNDVQFNVVAFVCDCSQPKLNLLLDLGVSGKNTFFEHPSTQKKICCFFDPPRLLEMMRKALVTKGFTFLDGTEMTREPLNKLLESGPYIFPDGTLFSPESMLNPSDEEAGNYDHAMELFSLTIATLLRKSSERESLVLAKFIETMYRWFQIMTSLYVDGNEQLVLHYKDREEQIATLNKTYEMVKSLRCIETNRINIFQEAILISIRSMECLSKEMSSMYDDKTILGNKLSQNSLDALLYLLQSSNKNGNVPPMNAIGKLRAVMFGVSNETEAQSILLLTAERYISARAFEEVNLKPIIREKSFDESLFTNSIKLDANTVIKNIEEENILDPLVEYLTKKHRKQFCSSDGKLPPKLSLVKDTRSNKFNALSFSNYARQMKSHCLNLEEIFKQINKDGTLLYKTKALKNFTDRIRDDVNLHPEIVKSFLLQRILVRLKYLNMSMDNDSSNDTDTDTF